GIEPGRTRAFTSVGLSPEATTRRRTSPGPGSGTGSSPTFRTSAAAPTRSYQAARILPPAAPGLDHLLLLALPDLVRAVAGLLQALVGVLAHLGGGASHLRRRARECDRDVLDRDLADGRALHLDGQAEVTDVRVRVHLLDVVDRPAGHAGLVEGVDPLGT